MRTRTGFALVVAGAAWFGAPACGSTAADAGRDANLQVGGAQFFRMALPADESGPKVVSVNLITNTIRPGSREKSLAGAVAPEATATAIALLGAPETAVCFSP